MFCTTTRFWRPLHILILAAVGVFVIFNAEVRAATPPSVEWQTIRVGFSVFPPWRIETEDGKEKGIEIEYLNELLRRMHLTPVYVHAPFIRNLKSMEDGVIDLMIGVLKRQDREQYMLFVDPPYFTGARYAFFMLSHRRDQIKNYADLQGKVIGVSNGVAYFQRFDEDNSLKKDSVRTVYQNIDKLLKGRIDVFINEEATAKYMLRKNCLQNIICEAQYKFQKPQSVYVTVSKRSNFAQRIKEFSDHIANMNKERAIISMEERFLNSQ